jgi:hypothetical protein
MMEHRQVKLRLISLGQYSKALVLPKWWIRLNDDPDEVKLSLSLGFIGIEPVKREGPVKQEVGGGGQQ